MFDNTEEEDLEMVYFVADAIREEVDRQISARCGGTHAIAIAAIMAMVRWARTHPLQVNNKERRH